jgi:hypothetical protein
MCLVKNALALDERAKRCHRMQNSQATTMNCSFRSQAVSPTQSQVMSTYPEHSQYMRSGNGGNETAAVALLDSAKLSVQPIVNLPADCRTRNNLEVPNKSVAGS